VLADAGSIPAGSTTKSPKKASALCVEAFFVAASFNWRELNPRDAGPSGEFGAHARRPRGGLRLQAQPSPIRPTRKSPQAILRERERALAAAGGVPKFPRRQLKILRAG